MGMGMVKDVGVGMGMGMGVGLGTGMGWLRTAWGCGVPLVSSRGTRWGPLSILFPLPEYCARLAGACCR